MIHEFTHPIPVDTPLGKGVAMLVEMGPHEHWWTVALTETRAFVTFKQQQLRISKNYTDGRGISDEQMMERIK